MTDAELVKPLAKGLEPLCAHEVQSAHREHSFDCCVERHELEVREGVDEPLKGSTAVFGREGLGFPDTGCGVHVTSLSSGSLVWVASAEFS